MSCFLNEKDLPEAIENLTILTNDRRNSQLQMLIAHTQKFGIKYLLKHMKTLFEKLHIILKEENSSIIIISTLQLLLEIINASPKEIEPNFNIVAGQIFIKCADSRSQIKKLALTTLVTFLKLTQNSEILLVGLLKHGISNPNPQVKKQVILTLIDFFAIQPSLIVSSPSFKTLIETLLDLSSRGDEDISSSTNDVLDHLNVNYNTNFKMFIKKLSSSNQDIIKRILEKLESRPDSTSPPFKGSDTGNQKLGKTQVNSSDETKLFCETKIDEDSYFITKDWKKPEQNTILGSCISSNNELFDSAISGIFPTRLINEICNQENWRSRADASEEMYNILSQLKSLDQIDNHLSEIIDLILKLINDVNFKICITALNIIGILINLMTDKQIDIFRDTLINNLIQKFGENKVIIRELTFQNLSLFINQVSPQNFIFQILPFLKNPNWHIRAECLILIKNIVKQSDKPIDYKTNLEIINKIVELIEDNKPKVRASALDTTATMIKTSKKENDILIKLKNSIVESTFQAITDKLTNIVSNNQMDDMSPISLNNNLNVYGREIIPNSNFQSSNQQKRSNTIGRPPIYGQGSSYADESNFTRSSDTENRASVRTRSQNTSLSNIDNLQYDIPKKTIETEGNKNYTPSNKNPKRVTNSPLENMNGKPLTPSKVGSNLRGSPYKDNTINYEKERMDSTYKNMLDCFKETESIKSRSSCRQGELSTTSAVTPLSQNKKNGIYDISTASSSISGGSRNTNRINSFESSFSNSIGPLAKIPKKSFLPNVMMNNDQARIQSAQYVNDTNNDALKITNEDEKRIYSANEMIDNQGYAMNLYNRLVDKAQKKEVFLDYSTTKSPEEFNMNPFDKRTNYDLEQNQNIGIYSNNDAKFPKIDKGQSNKYTSDNPYKSQTFEMNLKPKDLQCNSSKDVENESLKQRQKHQRHSLEGENRRESTQHQMIELHIPKENMDKRQGVYYSKVSPQAHASIEHEEIIERDESKIEENTIFNKSKKLRESENDKFESAQAPKRQEKLVKENSTNKNDSYPIEYKKTVYLAKDELTPIEGNPETILRSILSNLQSDDWSNQFDAMNNLRRLLCFHINILNPNNFSIHNITQEILKLIESLRSSLSKNAIITLTEMIQYLKKQMDSELESIIMKFIKKGMDTNCFILDEVKKGLTIICYYCSENKILPILFNMLNHKSTPAKVNICLCFEAIIEKSEAKISQLKDFERVLTSLSMYILDSSQEVRNASKRAFNILLRTNNRNEIDKVLQKSLNESSFSKIMQIFDKELQQNKDSYFGFNSTQQTSQNTKKPPIKSKPTSTTINTYSSSKGEIEDNDKVNISESFSPANISIDEQKDKNSKSLNYTMNKTIDISRDEKLANATTSKMKSSKMPFYKEGPEFENLPNLFAQADNSGMFWLVLIQKFSHLYDIFSQDWKSRYDVVTALCDFAQRNSNGLSRSKLSTKYIDYACKLLSDSNTKVSLFAITSFNDIIPLLKPVIESYTNSIMNTSFVLLGSANPSIRTSAETLFNQLIKTIDFNNTVPCLCNGLLFANVKAKSAILIKLIDIVNPLNEKRTQLITKNIIPTLVKMLDETKPELKNLLQKTLKCYYNVVGKSIMDSMSPSQVQQINEILSKALQQSIFQLQIL